MMFQDLPQAIQIAFIGAAIICAIISIVSLAQSLKPRGFEDYLFPLIMALACIVFGLIAALIGGT